jgi:multiple sugar transport system permease protein
MEVNGVLAKKSISFKNLGIFLLILAHLILILLPIFWVLSTSIKHTFEVTAIPPHFFKFKVTGLAYQILFGIENNASQDASWGGITSWSSVNFPLYLKNSFFTAAAATVISLFFGTLAGWCLARFGKKFKWVRNTGTWFLTLWMLPPIVAAVPLYNIFGKMGLYDTSYGLILAHITFLLPFTTWMSRGFFIDIPEECEESARVDGCSLFQALLKITLPLAKAGLAVTAVLSFIFSWNEFLLAMFLTSRNALTIPAAMPAFVQTVMVDPYTAWSIPAAAGVIAMIPVIIIMIPVQRFLIQGLTLGAIKG